MQNAYQRFPLNRINIDKNSRIHSSTWLLALYLFCAPLDFIQVIPGVSLMRFLIFLPLAGCFLRIKGMRIYLDRYFVILLLYVFMLIVTILYSYDSSISIQRTISVGQNIAVILVLSMFSYNKKEIFTIKKAMVYSGWLTLLLMHFYSDTSLMEGRMTIAVNGAFQDPNYLCGFLIFSIVYYYEEFIQKKNKISFVKMCIFLVFVLLTGSRGGLLAIFGSILLYTFIWMKDNRIKLSSIIKLFSLILLISIFFNITIDMLPESVGQRYDTSYTVNDAGGSRVGIWENALNSYEQLPVFNKLFGTGAGTIGYIFIHGGVSHNIWIESLLEIGIIGTCVLFTLYFLFFTKSYKSKEYVVSASFIGYMVMAMFLSLYSYKPIWNILLLIMILKNSRYEVKNNIKKDI